MSEILSETQHPYPREGTARLNREPLALDPASAPVDDRSTAHLLVYAWRLAGQIRFVEANLKEDGNWQPFLASDPLVVLARLTETVSEQWLQQYRDTKEVKDRVALLLQLLLAINEHANGLPSDLPPGGLLRRMIGTRLSPLLVELIGIYKQLLLPDSDDGLLQQLYTWLHPFWILDHQPLKPQDILADAGFDAKQKTSLDRLEGLRRDTVQAASWLSEQAENHFPSLLAQDQLHQPHMGLLLAFLQLFDQCRLKLNGLTARQLDHYFSEILKIERKSPLPDQAWLLFETAKNVASHKLEQGLRFKGGKDESGVELHYALESETILSQTNVKRLRNVFHDSKTDRLHAALKADSADGLGKEFEGNPRWLMMGSNSLPEANIGFAIGAALLESGGGRKNITIDLSFTPKSFSGLEEKLEKFMAQTSEHYARKAEKTRTTLFPSAFIASATGIKEWIRPKSTTMVFDHKRASIRFSLEFTEDQALVNYDPKIHARAFAASQPLICLMLNHQVRPGHYHLFQGLELSRIQIKAQVSGNRDILIQNDLGPVNPARPFLPFGPKPSVNSSLYVGSREVFSKQLDSLALNISWKKSLPTGKDTVARAFWLHQTRWEPVGEDRDPFSNTQGVSRIAFGVDDSDQIPPFSNQELDQLNQKELLSQKQQKDVAEPNPLNRFGAQPELQAFKDRDTTLARGFFKITLTSPEDPLGHETFPQRYATALAEKIAANGKGELPPQPEIPEALALSLDYSTSTELEWGKPAGSSSPTLFHIGPFSSWQVDSALEKTPLPLFGEEGRLYIGLEQVRPGQNLTLWFRLNEGGANPFITRPPVTWSYLAGAVWKNLPDTHKVKDSTLGLTTTGLITLSIPQDVSTQHQRMEQGLVWLRLTAASNTTALSPVMEIRAQAGSAIFVDRNNDPSHLVQPLAAGSIKKALVKDAALKKIEQPLVSSGGSPQEPLSPWRLRVSERLRHKDRAVESWDYEHLILQEFPEIHKVKCIPHTDFDNTRAPGHVTLALIPVLNPEDAFDPYRPAVSQALIARVEGFLKQRRSAQVNLHVTNPKYEPLRVNADVVLQPGFDKSFYKNQLTADLMQFLAPWAFDTEVNLLFGSHMHSSTILNFIEERAYVDYLTGFSVDRMTELDDLAEANVKELQARTARSILVTSKKHVIKIIEKKAGS